MSIAGAITYFALVGAGVILAAVLMFTFRAVKLI
ncbi:MAG: cytochrome b6-f complex subunit 6 [Oscillatoriaceae bacterium SKW80]|nr:cytochrome b6-f complex subunit 6 [Oscillatoriaceae bacterium SKYG93]MCX8121505.1 cytochrome b6-f complex subunit 6 [Oscillatoriaceae bacterium SKW80]MDW8452909.1 cytochrome b6-f complex subunit 6 [Oscillatoriaceae cyanobacterium SKYGB_i_bin93]HIK27850.1 cytochrome b6-f complex subunit 6 [Oscillatoriaceae cyanobacterium M7585_C2015_266]